MYQKTYSFGSKQAGMRTEHVILYSPSNGYGFVTEENREKLEALQISELNSAFEPWYWYKGQILTHPILTEDGVMLKDRTSLPLIFKADVPHQGNYQVTLEVFGGEEGVLDLIIFTGRRRLMNRGISIPKKEKRCFSYTINVCDIIPRGREDVFSDTSIDLSFVVPAPLRMATDITAQAKLEAPILYGQPILHRVTIEEVDVPTIYIAGDSTVTDQSGNYPYDPGCCYSGWAQAFPLYVESGIAVSNHAHSGLTTESFRSEGHYAIVEKYIRPGDFFFMQFGHNDQKLPHLAAKTGYKKNLIRYVKEVREKGAIPVIITPLARNTWASNKNTGICYNDLLKDWAEACLEVGKELSVSVIDLHRDSMEFIEKRGVISSTPYFYPKDYTHPNDYGAYLMAGFVAKRIKECSFLELSSFIKDGDRIWRTPSCVNLPTPSEGYPIESMSSLPSLDTLEHIDEPITRVEALDYVIKAAHFVPMNVYNDMYSDVIGHEWYAGVVEAAYQNKLVDASLTTDGKFYPQAPVTGEELLSFCINAILSRKPIDTEQISKPELEDVSDWAIPYLINAKALKLPDLGSTPKNPVTRKEAILYIRMIERILL